MPNGTVLYTYWSCSSSIKGISTTIIVFPSSKSVCADSSSSSATFSIVSGIPVARDTTSTSLSTGFVM